MKEFIPTLINTITWTPFYWDTLIEELNDEFVKHLNRREIETIYEKIKDRNSKFKRNRLKTLERIEWFLEDIRSANGAVAIRDDLYRLVIISILDVFG
jgi:hypothetical protein